MTNYKGSEYRLDYAKCTHVELRGFIKSRTGRECTSDKLAYLVGRLRALDRSATFRFLDLPVEMRLLVYGELFVAEPWKQNQDGNHRNSPEHSQILTTCREIQAEAEPEMYQNTKMMICIKTDVAESENSCMLNVNDGDEIEAANETWLDGKCRSSLDLQEKLPKAVTKARHIELKIIVDMFRLGSRRKRLRQIYRALFALTALLRKSKLLTLKIEFDLVLAGAPMVPKKMISILRPLYRINTSVKVSFQSIPDKVQEDVHRGIPVEVQEDILSHRLTEDSQPDSILRYQEVMEDAENAAELLHSNTFQDIEHIFKLAALSALIEKARILGPASKFYKQHETAGQQALEDLEKFEIIGKDCVGDVTRTHGYLDKRATRSHDVMSIYDV